VETVWQDLRYAARSLAARPAFTLVVVLTLSLGIGANSAIFSFVNTLVVSELPFREPDRLVRVMSRRGAEAGKLSMLELYELKEQARLFEDFASARNTQYNLTGDGPPEALMASVTSYNLYDLLGVKPLLGATWPASHERQRVFAVVLGYNVWKNRFGGDASIVGKKITLDAAPYEVLGVMPPGFNFPLDAELYRRVPPADFDSRSIRESAVIARLKPGVTIKQAQGELDAIAARWERAYPETNAGLRLVVRPLREQWIGDAGAYLWLLAGAVGCVLLIACVNVINLTLARALAREKEMAVRAALGATRARLVRQMLTESLLLTLAGGAVGLGLAALCVRLLARLIAVELPHWMKFGVDARVLGFTLALSIVTGVLAGLVPALQASKPDLNESLKESAKGSSGGARGSRVRRALVVAEVAFALVLLGGAGLMIQSFVRLRQTALGFDATNLLTLKVDPPWSRYKLVEETAPFYRRVIEEVERLPGVESAAFNDSLPLAGQDVREGVNKLTVAVEGQPPGERERNPFVNAQIVSPGYFRTLKIPLARGRLFDGRDIQNAPPVAVINERLARHFWPDRDPSGERLQLGQRSQNYRPVTDAARDDQPWLTVIGVVGDVRQRGVAGEAGLDVYVCDQQLFSPESYLAVRANVAPLALVEQVKQAVWKADPEQSVFDIRTMERRVADTIWQQRLAGVVMMLFAGLALTLAAVGIYGVMSYTVSQRTREIGVRVALGAQRRDVLKLVLGEGLKLIAVGAVLGLVASLVLTRVMASLLYGVGAGDPLTFVAVPLLLSAVALIACYLPARRAAKIDPLIALRQE
jgi:putative ABC transport system permease protein